jgi:hypothetical protein
VKYGVLADNASINETTYRSFEHLSERDQLAFVRKFREQIEDDAQVMHTFRELILGAYLAPHAEALAYDRRLNGLTPDWLLLSKSGEVAAIVELVNFHAPYQTEREVAERRSEGRVWVGRVPPAAPRLCARLADKAATYRGLANTLGVPYVVCVFAEFISILWRDEVRDCVLGPDAHIFSDYPEVSGVLFFEELAGRYSFLFIPSPVGTREISLPAEFVWPP